MKDAKRAGAVYLVIGHGRRKKAAIVGVNVLAARQIPIANVLYSKAI